MPEKKTSPYGSWKSPITPDVLLKGVVHMRNQMLRWDGGDLYWSGLRPSEGGRIVVCKRGADGALSDVTPPGFNARSRVHEYGGGHYAGKDGAVFFTNYPDQGLYRQAEFGGPQWVFGQRYYDFNGADEIVCLFTEPGGAKLGRLDLNTGRLTHIELLYTTLHNLRVAGGKAAVYGSSPTLAERVLIIDLETLAQEVVKTSNPTHIEAGYFGVPKPIEFPTERGRTAHAFFYAPRNHDYEAPDGEKPPLIVHVHGGPTGTAGPTYPFEFQYWTSRGLAFVDVNYGGSAGYGRAYRERLNGQWGVVDVDDCINAAKHLAAQGLVDPDRISITGGSAGGFTVLLSLTKRDFYDAGASHYGIGDLELFDGTTHKFESHYDTTLIGPYPERRDLYHDRSAIHFADRLSCPVLLLQGLEDRIVPPSQAETFVEACKQRKLPYAYVAFEGEQHGWRRESTIR